MAEVKTKSNSKSNIIIAKSLDVKYKNVVLFPKKHKRAMNHFKNRDIQKEISEALKKK